MTLPSSGAISFNSLVGEYGSTGSARALTHYYRGGQSGLVLNHSNNSSIPTSGTISLSNFYGQSNTSPNDPNWSASCSAIAPVGAKYSDYYAGVNSTTQYSTATLGSFSDTSFTNPQGTATFTMISAMHFTSTIITGSYVAIGGSHSGTFNSITGYSSINIGSTARLTGITSTGSVIGGNTWFYMAGGMTSSSGTMPSSGSHTFTMS